MWRPVWLQYYMVAPSLRLRYAWICGAAAALLAIGMACSPNGDVGLSSGGFQSILITPDSASVSLHSTQTFSASARDGAGGTISGVSFHWSSGNTGIATIDQNG